MALGFSQFMQRKIGKYFIPSLDDAESVDSVIEYFLEIDDCFISLYSEIANKSNSKNLREFLGNLVRLEEYDRVKALKNAS